MKERELNKVDKTRIKNYKQYFNEWFQEKAPKLSPNSTKLYARSVSLIAVHIFPSDAMQIDIDMMLNKLNEVYDLDDDDLSSIRIDDNINNLNTHINAIGKLIKLASLHMDIPEKLTIMEDHIRKVSIQIREDIIEMKSRNHKTENEEANMRPFNEYVEVANQIYDDYKSMVKKAKNMDDFHEGVRSLLPKLKFRNAILITLILLNKTTIDGKKLHSILRLVEYTDLILWKKKEEPPKDRKNYLSLSDRVIYLQHNKTTGGMSSQTQTQPTLKKFHIFNKKIIDMIKLYDDVYDIGHNKPLFTSTFKNGMHTNLNKTALSKLLDTIFKGIAKHTTIGLIRKSYDNRDILSTGKQKIKSARFNDHSLETVETFYKKI